MNLVADNKGISYPIVSLSTFLITVMLFVQDACTETDLNDQANELIRSLSTK